MRDHQRRGVRPELVTVQLCIRRDGQATRRVARGGAAGLERLAHRLSHDDRQHPGGTVVATWGATIDRLALAQAAWDGANPGLRGVVREHLDRHRLPHHWPMFLGTVLHLSLSALEPHLDLSET